MFWFYSFFGDAMKIWKITAIMLAVIALGCANKTTTNPAGNDVLTDTAANQDTSQGIDVKQPLDTNSKTDNNVRTDNGGLVDMGVCKPDCWYKECGPNGCGGTCGTCGNGTQCVKNKCVDKECDISAFAPTKAAAKWKTSKGPTAKKGTFTYYEISANAYPLSQLIIKIRQEFPFTGPASPINISIASKDLSSEPVQVIGLEGCPAPDKDCAHYYYASEGTLDIKKLNGASGPFEAVFHNAKLKEVTIDSSTGKMSFVNGGRTWCLDGHTVKADTVEMVPKATCVANGTGRDFNDNIGDFTLTNCLGDTVTLHSLCGGPKVMWMTVAAEWCPHCHDNLPIFWKYYMAHKDKVNYWIYIAEGEYGKDPTMANCKAYAQDRGIDPSHMFLGDHNWSSIIPYLNPETSQIGYPFSILMRGKNMEYVWSSAYGTEPTQEIDKLLNEK